MDVLKKCLKFLAPDAEKEEDGRDKWPSRLSFVLAAMGGAVGLGNILRYPSVVFENNGLQWFIPYLISLVFLAFPLMILEISVGQAGRAGGLVAFHSLNKRAAGVGVGTILTGYVVVCYYVPILCWVMKYFAKSFHSPLAWEGRVEDFYNIDVLGKVDPVGGSLPEDGSGIFSYIQYPGTAFVPETVAWCVFVWFVIWLCIFKGVGVTGRVVYVTMGLPIAMIFIILGRGVSLPNAVEGLKLYMGHWDSSKLSSGSIWQAAAGQIFFSTGVGFGYFTAFASYNTKFSNAVQDSIIIASCNSLYEVIGALGVFGVIGNLGLEPGKDELGTFTVSFLTYPEAIVAMPGANFWGLVFFVTIMLVGISSAFALLESVVTLVCDTDWAKKFPRPLIVTIFVVISFLLSLMYCTEFGFHLLGAVDTWANNLSLLFVAWAECTVVTTLYRHRDVIGQVGIVPYFLFHFSYFAATLVGLGVAHSAGPSIGAGVGFGIFIVGSVAATLLSKTPDAPTPAFLWGRRLSENTLLRKYWWVAFYSGYQLSVDLNLVVAQGKNWSIPPVWGAILRYISAPILAIIISFAYPDFYEVRNDPLNIFAFGACHVCIFIIIAVVIVPRSLQVFVPKERLYTQEEETYAPGMALGPTTTGDSEEKGDSTGVEIKG